MKSLIDIFSKILNSKPIVEKIEFNKSMMGTDENIAMTFNVFDGLGYCEDFEGNEYILSYPKLEFVNNCKVMLNAVKEFVGIKEEDEITISDVLRSYGSLYRIEKFTFDESKTYALNTKETAPKIIQVETETTKVTPNDTEYYEADVYRP